MWEGWEKQRGIERGREKDERRGVGRAGEERKEQLRDNHTPNISTASWEPDSALLSIYLI